MLTFGSIIIFVKENELIFDDSVKILFLCAYNNKRQQMKS